VLVVPTISAGVLLHGQDVPIGMQGIGILDQQALAAAPVKTSTAAIFGTLIDVHDSGRHPHFFAVFGGTPKVVGILWHVADGGSVLAVVPGTESAGIAGLAGTIPVMGQHQIVSVPFSVIVLRRRSRSRIFVAAGIGITDTTNGREFLSNKSTGG
jgi:hypothetical protein